MSVGVAYAGAAAEISAATIRNQLDLDMGHSLCWKRQKAFQREDTTQIKERCHA